MTSIELHDKKWLLKGNITFKEILLILDQVNQYGWEESIILDLSSVKEIDTTLVSFILEQKRQAKKFGKELNLENSPESLKSLASLYGIENLI
jgi:phospholipid transport system transporter-binding protein